MSYIESGFDENLIRHGYSGAEDETVDSINSGELFEASAVPITDVLGELEDAGVINTSNQVIQDIVNANLDTQSKEILGEFVFVGSGALAIKTDDNNGIWISPTGILAKKAGVNKFTLESDGDATFGGELVAPIGTIGALTIASGGNIKMGKTAFTDDTNAGFFIGDVSGVAKFKMGSSATKYFSYDGTDIAILGGTITGGIIQTATTGYRLRLNGANNKIELLNGDTVISTIYADAGGSLILNSVDDVYFTKGGSNMLRINSNGDLNIASSGVKLTWGSGRYLDDSPGDGLAINGGFASNQDDSNFLGRSNKRWSVLYAKDCRCNNYFSGDGSQGQDFSTRILTAIDYDGDQLRYKYRDVTFKDGLATSNGGESGWNNVS